MNEMICPCCGQYIDVSEIRTDVIEECIDSLDYCVTVSECQNALRELKERIDV